MNRLSRPTTHVILAFLLLLMVSACRSKDTVQSQTTGQAEDGGTKKPLTWEEKGYVEAVVTFDEMSPSECQFTLTTASAEHLESIAFPKEMRMPDQKVWVKFAYQRRPSRCAGAQPVEIVDMVERK